MDTRHAELTDNRSPYHYSLDDYNNLKTLQLLGEGAYGVVMLAKNLSTQNHVALKILDTMGNGCKKKTSLEACNNEINIMIALTEKKVPNTVAIHGYFISDASCYIAMTYMPKGSLDLVLQATNGAQQKQIMYGMANALVYMHEYDIVHCDIKPANILLDNNFDPHLCDFGQSKNVNMCNLKNITGSPVYMAPEILSSMSANSKSSDIYSLSMTYWQILEQNSRPFSWVRNFPALFDWVVKKGNAEVISSRCHPSIAGLVTWGWAQKAAERPTAQQLKNELEKILDNEACQAVNLF